MKNITFVVFMWMLLGTTCILAKGVLAGTEIMNTSTLEYEIDGSHYSTTSNATLDKVDQIIDVSVVWNDAAAVLVSSGESNQVLTFKITNLGNGRDTFNLTHETNATNDFTVNNPRIYIDTNNNGVFDISSDQQASSITLDADAFAILFLVSDIPTDSYPSGSTSNNAIVARSTTGGSGVQGTIYEGAGIGGVFAVDGMSGGVDKGWGIYLMGSDVAVKLTKSATLDGKQAVSGATVRYYILVELQGYGSAKDLIITDAVPSGTSYVAGSLTLDGVSLSDAGDSDSGRFTGSAIEVSLGTATQTSSDAYSKTISFEVVIS